ncbi:hypothetical protein RIR_jg17151.t1 [Rhizophagus irregularis DAOM 181602=DAOM 197198]|nr:hypothetical protein RIR_jg17151.t1 [Rhizophagus irregularis DAOM 181602=DAOM 197198]
MSGNYVQKSLEGLRTGVQEVSGILRFSGHFTLFIGELLSDDINQETYAKKNRKRWSLQRCATRRCFTNQFAAKFQRKSFIDANIIGITPHIFQVMLNYINICTTADSPSRSQKTRVK